MKIAILAHQKFPIRPPFVGGLERFTYDLVMGLQKFNIDVTLFGHKDSSPELNLCSNWRKYNWLSDVQEYEQYSQLVDCIAKGEFDLVHDNSLGHGAILLQDKLKCPLVTTLHVPPMPVLKEAIDKRIDGHYVSVSKCNAKSWGLEDKCTIIPNGVNTNVFKYCPFYHEDYVVWSGRICPEKGTHYAIEAALKAGVNLVIAGHIFNQEYYEEKVKPFIDNNQIKYIGHLGRNDLVKLLQGAFATLFTSIWDEPFGLVIIESLSCGTPVIGFNSGAIKEILTDDTGIIVNKEDVNSLAKSITKAKDLFCYSCRKLVIDKFSIESMTVSYINKYIEIIG